MKSFFENETEDYTEAGYNFFEQIKNAIKPIVDFYITEGYSVREIQSILNDAGQSYCSRKILDKCFGKNR